jgi:hypothetical protein
MLKDARSTVFYQFPSNVPAESRYNEIFLLETMCILTGSTEIPNRYVQLTQGQVKVSKTNWKCSSKKT